MRRLRLWKILVGVAVFLALSIAGIWARFELKWRAMKALTRQLAEEAAARDSRRPSILGRDVPGNAWDDYSAGLKAFSEVIEALEDPYPPVLGPGDFDLDDDAERILTRLQPGFENLRQGASRAEARYPADWTRTDLGYPNAVSGMSLASQWVYAALNEHRRLRTEPDAKPALELLLATAQFAMDAGRNAPSSVHLSSWGWLLRVKKALLPLLGDPRLGSQDLLEVERTASAAESWMRASAGPALRNSVLSYGLGYGKGDVGRLTLFGFDYYRLKPGWRHAWCNRYLLADAMLLEADWSDRLARSIELPLPEAERAWTELQEARSNSDNDLADRFGVGRDFDHAVYVKELRVEIAEWRLVRAAAGFRRSGEVPPLADPFGAMLMSRVEGKTVRIWSLGPDLLDADGVVGKSYTEGDLVLEISR